jgi:hypothetical protein
MASLDSRYEVWVWDVGRGVPVDHFAAPLGGMYATNAAIALSDDGRRLAYAGGGESASGAVALIRDVMAHKLLQRWDDLPGGYELLTADGPGRFLLVREEFELGRQSVQTVVRSLAAGQLATAPRVLRHSRPGDRRAYIASGLTSDGSRFWWIGPREPPDNYRLEIYQFDNGKPVQARPLPSPKQSPTLFVQIDPSGQRMWREEGETVTLYDLDGRQSPRVVPRFPTALTARGEWQAFHLRDWRGRKLLALQPAGAAHPWLTTAGDGLNAFGATFSPDGRYLTIWQSGLITVLDLPALKRSVDKFEAELRTSN